jgi:hypothetical protein
MNRRISFLLAVVLVICLLKQSALSVESTKLLTLLLRPNAGTTVCEFQGKIVPKGQLLNVLGRSYEHDGSSVRLNILIHQDVTLSDIFLVQGSVGKVGFTNIKTFCFDRKQQVLWELSIGPQRSFTVKP